MTTSQDKKVLIFIVAFNAEKHIERVLARIPPRIFTHYDYHILLIDDSSSDTTFTVAKLYQALHREVRLTVLFNPDNLGYGGNQKLGYHYAIQHDYDIVVLLHGDGQYAPELLEDMLAPLLAGTADVVLGSRFLRPTAALRGGMPLYKYLGNRVLTGIQNALLGTHLSEFHSGYRAYSVSALRRIPFERNSNDFHFDTQILIQLLNAGCTIQEIAIPTYYGDEICHVNGVRYAWNVVKATLLSRAHTLSILYQREYDAGTDPEERYTPKLGYPSSHTVAVDAVPERSRVFELGCNQGHVSQELRRKGCYVVGCDALPLRHPDRVDEFHLIDLNRPEHLPALDRFDVILLLDVLEHLDDPELFLDTLRARIKRGSPRVIITAPNVAFFIIRFQLLFAQFNYGRQGILDLTHKRLFTFQSLKKLCLGAGYRILAAKGIPAPFPKAIGLNGLSRFLLRLNGWLIRLSRGLFSYQIYLEVRATPVVGELLSHAFTESSRRES